jgi:hypothetical protein
MESVAQLVNRLKSAKPSADKILPDNDTVSFETDCTFADEPADLSPFYPFDIPDDLREFWSVTKEAELFTEKKYRQWGLKILSPEDALKETALERKSKPHIYNATELVIGVFFGDSDRLILDCHPDNSGNMLVALPIDPRKDWPVVATSLTELLNLYAQHKGEKYWEKSL